MRSSSADPRDLAPARGRGRGRAAARGTSPAGSAGERRSRRPGGAGDGVADPDDARVLGPWGRLVLGTLLVGAALLGPAVGYASAQFGDSATVTISVTVPATSPTTTPPTAAPTATLPAPPDLP